MWKLLFLAHFSSAFISFPLERRVVSGLHSSRKWRRLYSGNSEVYKQNDGVYYGEICIGKHVSQCFTVIMDTGSSSIAIPCQGCDCGHQHRKFIPMLSDSVSSTGKKYFQCYGEGSCNTGEILLDNICIGEGCSPADGITHPFGCCKEFAPSFQHQEADGILGLSPSGNTLWKDMLSHHKLTNSNIAICFGPTHGELMIGGWDTNILDVNNIPISESIRFTPMMTRDNYFRMEIHAISIDNKALSVINTFSPMVDSGSTFSFMQNHNWQQVRDGFILHCQKNSTCISEKGRNPPGSAGTDAILSVGCYAFSHISTKRLNQMKSFPNITFEIPVVNGTNYLSMSFSPEQYFFLSGEHSNVYCVGIFKDMMNVIGANLLENFLIVFQENPSIMGIAKARCSRTLADKQAQNVTKNPPNATQIIHINADVNILAIFVGICLTIILFKKCVEVCSTKEYKLIQEVGGEQADEEQADEEQVELAEKEYGILKD